MRQDGVGPKEEEAKGQLLCQQPCGHGRAGLSLCLEKKSFKSVWMSAMQIFFNIYLLHTKSTSPCHSTRNFCPNFCNFQWKQIQLSLIRCFFSWGFILLMGITHPPCDSLWAPTLRGASGYWTPPLPASPSPAPGITHPAPTHPAGVVGSNSNPSDNPRG